MVLENQFDCSTSWKPALVGIELAPGVNADEEGQDRGPQRDVARVLQRLLRLAAQQRNADRAGDGQDQQRREHPVVGHQRNPPNRYQVASAATPISIAKA